MMAQGELTVEESAELLTGLLGLVSDTSRRELLEFFCDISAAYRPTRRRARAVMR